MMCLPPVSARELVGVNLSADAVDADREIVIGDGSVPRLYAPKGFRESVDSGRGVEDDFCTVESKAHPMQRMVSAVADVDADPPKLSLEDGVSRLAFHVVCGLIEVAYPWNVTLFLLPEDVAVVVDHHCAVVQRLLHSFALENRRDDDDVVPPCEFAQHLRGLSVDGLRELHPRIAFAGAHKKRGRPNFLQSDHVHALECGEFDDLLDAFHDCAFLLLHGPRSVEHDFVLDCAYLHCPLGPYLLFLAVDSELLHFDVDFVGALNRFLLQRDFGCLGPVQNLSHALEDLPRQVRFQCLISINQLTIFTIKFIDFSVIFSKGIFELNVL